MGAAGGEGKSKRPGIRENDAKNALFLPSLAKISFSMMFVTYRNNQEMPVKKA